MLCNHKLTVQESVNQVKIFHGKLDHNTPHIKEYNYCFDLKWIKIVSEFEDKGVAYYFSLQEGEDYCFYSFIKREIQAIEDIVYYDIISPFDYGGMVYSDNKLLEKFFRQFNHYCKKENIVSEFIRFCPSHTFNMDIINKYMHVSKVNDLIYIDLTNDFYQQYNKGRKSDINTIKKINYNIQTVDIISFYTLYCETMNRNKANEYFYFNINSLKKILDNSFGRIFGIFIEGKLLSSIFIIDYNDISYYFLSSSSSNQLSLSANAMLLHEVANILKEEKKKMFFLGGGREGVYNFKKYFSKERIAYYIGCKIHNNKIYKELVDSTNREGNDFFPQYREKII